MFSKATQWPSDCPACGRIADAAAIQAARLRGRAVLWRRWRAGLFGINALVSGDWNYMGGGEGDRNSFYTHFPFDDRGTAFEAGNTMTTNQANDEHLLDPEVIGRLLPRNAWYFLVGRDAGLIPYFFPGALIVLIWLLRIRKATDWQLATAAGCVLGVLALLILPLPVGTAAADRLGIAISSVSIPRCCFCCPPAPAGSPPRWRSVWGGRSSARSSLIRLPPRRRCG